jgi:Leucine-rich repeat (LRR) protein
MIFKKHTAFELICCIKITLILLLFVNIVSAQTGLLSPSALSAKKDYKILQEALNETDSVYKLSLMDVDLSKANIDYDSFTNLQSIRLYNNNINTFPADLTLLHYVQEIRIYENKITYLPPSISALTNLKILEIRLNGLFSIPVQIGNLTNLVELDLSYNRLTTLPQSISNLHSLQKLTLQGNFFSDMERIRIKNMLPNCKIIFY